MFLVTMYYLNSPVGSYILEEQGPRMVFDRVIGINFSSSIVLSAAFLLEAELHASGKL